MSDSLEKIIVSLSKISFLKRLYRNLFRKDLAKLEDEVFNSLIQLKGLTKEAQAQIVNTSLLKLIQHAANNSPYYKKVFAEHSISINSLSDFPKIPFLTKDIIRANTKELISSSAKSTEMRKSNTGGSTGQPLEFYTDNYSSAVDNAHHKFLFHLMGYEPGDVIIDSGGLKISSELREKNIYWIKYPPGSIWGNYGFSALYLNKENIAFYIDKLLELKPSIIRGYPSFVNELALYLLEKNIVPGFRVKGINLTAEFCSDIQKENIKKAFSTRIYLEYGQGEKTVYCWSNGESDLLYSSPYYGYVEVLDANGNTVKPGEEGEIVVTSLCNYSMPFIRYKTGDRGIPAEINNGIVTFSKILGRTQDFIVDKKNNKVFLTALIFGQHFKAFKNIRQWQIVQDKPGQIKMLVVKEGSYSGEDEKEIIEKITRTSDIDIQFIYADTVRTTGSGKKLFLIQNIGK